MKQKKETHSRKQFDESRANRAADFEWELKLLNGSNQERNGLKMYKMPTKAGKRSADTYKAHGVRSPIRSTRLLRQTLDWRVSEMEIECVATCLSFA